jgi:hypothetical protein
MGPRVGAGRARGPVDGEGGREAVDGDCGRVGDGHELEAVREDGGGEVGDPPALLRLPEVPDANVLPVREATGAVALRIASALAMVLA